MTARLEHKLDKDKNITQLFIDSEDGSKNICILKSQFTKYSTFDSQDYKEANYILEKLVDHINIGIIKVGNS